MSNDAVTMAQLGDVAEARPGYPFRGAIKSVPGGELAVVQIKNADPEQGVDWGALVSTTPAGRKSPDWLRSGDVLFIARGNRNVAVHLDQVPARAVCAPQFYLLRVRGDLVLPAYLAWYLNEGPAQRYFEQSAEGSVVTSIRRQILEALPLPIPDLQRQQLIVNLVDTARREKQLTEQLIRNREQQLTLVARGLIQ
ncbi:restriction endonuclease subunit S [Haliea salexigens]|uniref:restriction endonuclease subunit S n=1 Tax=Haliea salexigens TaxID=287487 RepID=UPI0004077F8C|nr:restriction endonuclease subunit S [Haliea salexigens]